MTPEQAAELEARRAEMAKWRHDWNWDVCPVTGLPREDGYKQAHTRDDRPGPYNACYQCDPDTKPAGQILRELNDRLEREAGDDR